MYALLALAVIAALAMGGAKAAHPTEHPPAPPAQLDPTESAALEKKDPKFFTTMMNALMNAATNPADLFLLAAGAGLSGFPKISAFLTATYMDRTNHVVGASGKTWRTWVNVDPSPTLTAANIAGGWKETHVMATNSPAGNFEGQRILVFGQKGSDKASRALGGVWSPLPMNLPADVVPTAKKDFGLPA